MKRKLFEWLIRTATFVLCFALFWLVFRLCSADFFNSLGYLLWLRASPEDQANYFRLLFAERTLPLAASLVAGGVGVAVFTPDRGKRAWAWIRRRIGRGTA